LVQKACEKKAQADMASPKACDVHGRHDTAPVRKKSVSDQPSRINIQIIAV
jgi:hypothetical protein